MITRIKISTRALILLVILIFTTNTGFAQVSSPESKSTANRDTLPMCRALQVSFLPYISINRPPTNDVVNVSLNIIAGRVREVRKAEVGGVLNIVREDAGKCQLAGVGNMVGGSFQGLQAAGVYNMTQSLEGVQAGGVINMVKANAGSCQLAGVGNMIGGSFVGLQAAGIFNMAQSIKGAQACGVINIIKADAGKCQVAGVGNTVGGSFQGLQAAGVYNMAQSIKGAQACGVINIIKADAGKFQVAGVGNTVGGSFQGFQAAGVFNFTKNNVDGVQIAGVLNNAKEVSGIQISGLVNRASFFKGVQLSVFNFADSCQGIPIGVMSFVRKNGYYKIELSADEIIYTNLAFRTGINRFYTSVMAGIRPDNFAKPLWTYGFGIGTKFGKQSNFSYDLELSSQHISKQYFSDYVSDLHKLYFGIDRKLTPSASIAIGVTYNFFITDTDAPHYNEKLSTIAPYTLTNDTYGRNGINIKTWLGAKIAFRFL